MFIGVMGNRTYWLARRIYSVVRHTIYIIWVLWDMGMGMDIMGNGDSTGRPDR